MALSFDQGAKLTKDISFFDRVTMAMVRCATEVTKEDTSGMTTMVASKRRVLANRIIETPSSMANSFVALVASDPNTALGWWDLIGIASSTDADPIVITTVNSHGYVTGDIIEILNHTGNVIANGTHNITVISDTTYSIPVPGSVAGTGGTSQKQIDDGDLFFTISALFQSAAGILPGE